MRIAGRIDRVRFYDAETGSGAVIATTPQGNQVQVAGTFSFAPAPGRYLEGQGRPEVHPRVGEQIKVPLIVEGVPRDREGLTEYLQRVARVVDAQMARRLVERFGAELPGVIETRPSELYAIPQCTKEVVEVLQRSWDRASVVRRLWLYLSHGGVSPEASSRIYRKYGAKALEVAVQRPYELASVSGVEFEAVDRLAASHGAPEHSNARTAAAVLTVMARAERSGHTCVALDVLARKTEELLQVPVGRSAGVEVVVASLAAKRALQVTETPEGRFVSTPSLASDEEAIAFHIVRLIKGGPPVDEDGVRLGAIAAAELKDKDQMAGITNAFRHPVSVITGGPGCGKTTVSKVIGAVADEVKLEMRLSAPTNKAARRVEEASGRPASTLHFRLGCRAADNGDGFTFDHNERNRLDGDLFTIDEMTLADTRITRAFLEAIPTGARLLVSGDVDQLKSVGAGEVFADLISSGVLPVTRLNTPHRAALNSAIVRVAHQINKGLVEEIDLKQQGEVRFIEARGEAAVAAAVRKRYQELIDVHGVNGVQVLASQYKTGVGVDALNLMLREIANPPDPAKPEVRAGRKSFRLGDRVVRDSTYRYQLPGEETTRLVANGEVGQIVQVDKDRRGCTVKFGGQAVHQDAKAIAGLDHAVVLACHRAQGTEEKAVLTVAPKEHASMLTRALIFTALTRGKKQSDLVTDPATFRAAVLRPEAKRSTLLRHHLRRMAPALRPEQAVQRQALAASSRSDVPADVARTPPRPARSAPDLSPQEPVRPQHPLPTPAQPAAASKPWLQRVGRGDAARTAATSDPAASKPVATAPTGPRPGRT